MSGHVISSTRRGGPRQRSECGAVAVEFALVLPILVMLLMGTVTAGLAYSHSIGLTNAVREGARFGATTEDSSTWGNDVIARTRALQFDDGGTPPETAVCAQLRKTGTSAPLRQAGDCATDPDLDGPTSPAGFQTGDCFVWVAGSRPFEIVTVIAPKWDKTMLRSSAARFERDCP